jgi:hypothetical protein
MQQMYNAIRAEGANNLVVVDGTHWAATPPALRVSGYNIVYAAHMYTCPDSPPPNCTVVTKIGPVWLRTQVPNPYDPTPLFNRWTSFAAANPLIVDEFGWPNPNDGRYNANLIAVAEARGLSWIAYAWTGSTTGKFSLLTTAGPGTWDPSPSGVPVENGWALNP